MQVVGVSGDYFVKLREEKYIVIPGHIPTSKQNKTERKIYFWSVSENLQTVIYYQLCLKKIGESILQKTWHFICALFE